MNANQGSANSGRSKPWLVPLMLVLLVGSLGWIGWSVFMTDGPVVMESPRDLFMQEVRTKLSQDERFAHVEVAPSLEDESAVLLFGEVEEDGHADDLRALIGEPPAGLSVSVEVSARPGGA